MLMLILKIVSIATLVGIAVAMFVDSYNSYKRSHDKYESLANCFLFPLFILFTATFLAMLYVVMG